MVNDSPRVLKCWTDVVTFFLLCHPSLLDLGRLAGNVTRHVSEMAEELISNVGGSNVGGSNVDSINVGGSNVDSSNVGCSTTSTSVRRAAGICGEFSNEWDAAQLLAEDALDAVARVARQAEHPGLVDDADAVEDELDRLLEENHTNDFEAQLSGMQSRILSVLEEYMASALFDGTDPAHKKILDVVRQFKENMR